MSIWSLLWVLLSSSTMSSIMGQDNKSLSTSASGAVANFTAVLWVQSCQCPGNLTCRLNLFLLCSKLQCSSCVRTQSAPQVENSVNVCSLCLASVLWFSSSFGGSASLELQFFTTLGREQQIFLCSTIPCCWIALGPLIPWYPLLCWNQILNVAYALFLLLQILSRFNISSTVFCPLNRNNEGR